VENHLGELWSILDFLMPGCLGSEREFKQHYRVPIERHGDSRRLQQLLDRIAPFILRRDKDQVAADLPAKTVIEQTISMGDAQRDFYQQLKQQSWQDLQSSMKQADTSARQQVLLLNGLLKLRQACCDPALLGQAEIASAKREHCMAMIEELVAENRAILVFSQFTRMLDFLAEDLEKLNIDYLMLTGQSRQRQLLVDSFQQGRAPVFLISLKAGGVGLNLTRADTVIHYDPWWNQAAEQQATDRAHRIGQDKPVFAYKLIVENSIEEKIARLQQRKALLGQHISHQGQLSAEQFSLKLDELLALWGEE
jgi:SNF2 family DNA or RNA helicase